MTDLEKMREWIRTFVDSAGNGVPDNFFVDFTNEIPQNAGLFPTGTMEISRRADIAGNITVTNQYNFGLYAVFEKPADHEIESTRNAQWVMDFQQWVQDQSIMDLTPKFGNTAEWQESIKAQNGMFYGEKEEGATGIYMITIAVQFKKYYPAGGN